MSDLAPQGCVHGRFQPPHNGHLEYFLAAKARCNFLWIGITRYDLFDVSECPIARHRQDKESNPFTFYERITLIKTILTGSGVAESEFGFIPFPIDEPQRLSQFLPKSVICFTTVYDKWNQYKVDVLRSIGYTVEVLWERDVKEVSGQAVRASLAERSESWKDLVPSELIDLIGCDEAIARVRGELTTDVEIPPIHKVESVH